MFVPEWRDQTIIIHTHPRTGSSSLANYLADAIGTIPFPDGLYGVRRVHYLVDEENIWYSWQIRQVIEKIGKENCKPITIIRNPVDVNVSLFWYHYANRNVAGVDDPKVGLRRFYEELEHFAPVYHYRNEVRKYWGDREDLLVLDFRQINDWPGILEECYGIPKKPMRWDHKTTDSLPLDLGETYQDVLMKSWEDECARSGLSSFVDSPGNPE